MKALLKNVSMALLCLLIACFTCFAQTIQFDANGKFEYHFNENIQSSALPPGIVFSGKINYSKAEDGDCSKGMVQINQSPSTDNPNYIDINLPSCGSFIVHMKSTSATSERTVTVSYSTDGGQSYTAISPVLKVKEAAIFNIADADGFEILKSNSPIIVRLQATSGNTQIHDLFVTKSSAKRSDTEIIAFKMSGQVGAENINYSNGTIEVNVASGTNLLNVTPTSLIISSGATVFPTKETNRDFSNGTEVKYTITAEDGIATKEWIVKVNSVLSSENEIVNFKLSPDQIGNAFINSVEGLIKINVPISVNISAITPEIIQLSDYADISPARTTVLNFNTDVVYKVTAQDGSVKNWAVQVTKIDPNVAFTTYEAEDALYTGKIDTQHAGFSGSGFIDFLSGGENHITFDVCQQTAGIQTLKIRYAFAKDEDRSANLYVNNNFIQVLAFPVTSSFTEWSEVLTAVNLQTGVNNIKLTWDLTDGPNLDKIEISGQSCASYMVNVIADNGGVVSLSPERKHNKYFQNEEVKLLAQEKANLKFLNWTGDISGTENPKTVVVNGNKNITAQFQQVQTYKLNVTINGIGEVTLSPTGGEYAAGTEVTLTANSILGSTFQGWSGALSGSTATQIIVVSEEKNIIANFANENIQIDFKKPVGFAAANGDGFNGPTTGGDAVIPGKANKIEIINGPTEFPKLCKLLKDRIRYKAYSDDPLTIILESGIYTGENGTESVWGNQMLDIQEQANLTIIGRKNVTFNFGINVKRSHNIIIRNITFQDYYDDGINIGNTETHHIWVDHCTVGHQTTMPANTEHPDGGIDIKDGASYVTISWTVYRNSWKTGLIGHSDSNGSTDLGRLKVTHYANHYFHTNSRNPRVRFGEVHVLNCLGENVLLYGIAASNLSQVYAENNFYLNTRWPMYADRASADFNALYQPGSDATFSSKTGNKVATGLKQVGNEYDDSELPVITSKISPAMLNPGGRSVKFDEFNPELVFDPSTYYSYTPFPASVVRVVVPMFAGADKIDWFPDDTLPIEFTDFKVQIEKNTSGGQQVKLSWKVYNQNRADKFEIVKINGNQQESVLHTAQANGSLQYSFIDRNPVKGISYYKLIQYDKNGEKFEGNIVPIKITEEHHFCVYPNPVSKDLSIEHPEKSHIVVLDFLGKTKFEMESQNSSTSVNVSNWADGIYIIKIRTGNLEKSLKFVKQ